MNNGKLVETIPKYGKPVAKRLLGFWGGIAALGVAVVAVVAVVAIAFLWLRRRQYSR